MVGVVKEGGGFRKMAGFVVDGFNDDDVERACSS
jgi:hypothetical protein